jgi:NAD+ synthase (glutamine-hydrolysing)
MPASSRRIASGSHSNVNSSVSKTLIQHLIRFVADSGDVNSDTANLLKSILAAVISLELVPPEDGGSPQSTGAVIGPYALQDFHLYYTARYGFRPSKVAYLACCAWNDAARGSWPTNIPPTATRLMISTKSKSGFVFSCIASLRRVSLNVRSCRTGPRSSGGSLSARGIGALPRIALRKYGWMSWTEHLARYR